MRMFGAILNCCVWQFFFVIFCGCIENCTPCAKNVVAVKHAAFMSVSTALIGQI